MKKFSQLVLATTNPGKIKEIKHFFRDLPLQILSLADLKDFSADWQVEETGSTFSQNAKQKALAVGKLTNLPVLADDSGLKVDFLQGKPGVKSRRFARNDQARITKLLRLLNNVPLNKRRANFTIALALYLPQTGKTKIFLGKTFGHITRKPHGSHGFGYDPIFYSQALKKTFAQASIKEKNQVSHRSRALKKVKKFLLSQFTAQTRNLPS